MDNDFDAALKAVTAMLHSNLIDRAVRAKRDAPTQINVNLWPSADEKYVGVRVRSVEIKVEKTDRFGTASRSCMFSDGEPVVGLRVRALIERCIAVRLTELLSEEDAYHVVRDVDHALLSTIDSMELSII